LLENQQQQQQQHQQKDFTTYLIVGKGYIAGAIFHAGKFIVTLPTPTREHYTALFHHEM